MAVLLSLVSGFAQQGPSAARAATAPAGGDSISAGDSRSSSAGLTDAQAAEVMVAAVTGVLDTTPG